MLDRYVARYIERHISVDISTDTRPRCWLTYRSTLGRYVDQYVGPLLTDMLVEGCTKYTRSQKFILCQKLFSSAAKLSHCSSVSSGWLFIIWLKFLEQARLTKFSSVIGYPSGQDGITLLSRPWHPQIFFAAFRVTFLMLWVCFRPIMWYTEKMSLPGAFQKSTLQWMKSHLVEMPVQIPFFIYLFIYLPCEDIFLCGVTTFAYYMMFIHNIYLQEESLPGVLHLKKATLNLYWSYFIFNW